MTPRGYAYLALAVVLGLVIYLAGSGLYEAGRRAERLEWVQAQDEARIAAQAAERASTAASESVADTTRAEAAKVAAETTATTGAAQKEIVHVYRDRQVPADCPAPGPVPDGVRARFAEARAATAAARGLPAAVGR